MNPDQAGVLADQLGLRLLEGDAIKVKRWLRSGCALIISHKHQFVFIKTNKTAGTSIEIALSRFCGPEDIITPVSTSDERKRLEWGGVAPQNYGMLRNHSSGEDARMVLGDERWRRPLSFVLSEPLGPGGVVILWRKRVPHGFEDYIRSKEFDGCRYGLYLIKVSCWGSGISIRDLDGPWQPSGNA